MKSLLAENKNTQCVAVGLLHMAGEHGLVKQFDKSGYKVKQLK
jgi:uncharacterized protein YbaP (TraB family)